MKTAVAFGPYGEFHAFSRFDCAFLRKLKQDHRYHRIVAVVPYVAASLITYVHEILCVSTEFLAKVNGHYPYVLNNNNRDVPGYVDSGFMKKAIEYVEKRYSDIDYYYFHEGTIPCKEIMNELPKKCDIISCSTKEKYNNDPQTQFDIEFPQIGTAIEKDDRFIYPFLEDKNKINDKYKNLFVENTFIILTRNFSWKTPGHNTNKETLIPYIEKALNKGYGIINIGFPCMALNINHKNYHELSDNTTYSEFVCLMYMSKGIIAQGGNASASTLLRLKMPIIITRPLMGHYENIWKARINKGIYSKLNYVLENPISTHEDFLRSLNDCTNINYEKQYISNNKYIILDKI